MLFLELPIGFEHHMLVGWLSFYVLHWVERRQFILRTTWAKEIWGSIHASIVAALSPFGLFRRIKIERFNTLNLSAVDLSSVQSLYIVYTYRYGMIWCFLETVRSPENGLGPLKEIEPVDHHEFRFQQFYFGCVLIYVLDLENSKWGLPIFVNMIYLGVLHWFWSPYSYRSR